MTSTWAQPTKAWRRHWGQVRGPFTTGVVWWMGAGFTIHLSQISALPKRGASNSARMRPMPSTCPTCYAWESCRSSTFSRNTMRVMRPTAQAPSASTPQEDLTPPEPPRQTAWLVPPFVANGASACQRVGPAREAPAIAIRPHTSHKSAISSFWSHWRCQAGPDSRSCHEIVRSSSCRRRAQCFRYRQVLWPSPPFTRPNGVMPRVPPRIQSCRAFRPHAAPTAAPLHHTRQTTYGAVLMQRVASVRHALR